jgi:hypothetical protein
MTNRESRTRLRMRTAGAALALALAYAPPALAEPFSYPSDGDNPLRVTHTFVSPVGTILEWTVTRPIAALGHLIAPYRHIDSKGFQGCSRERPARSCTAVVK